MTRWLHVYVIPGLIFTGEKYDNHVAKASHSIKERQLSFEPC